MATLRRQPPKQFREAVQQEELELHGVHARAFRFLDGSRNPKRAVVCIAGMGANGRSFVRQRDLARDHFVLMLNMPSLTPLEADPLQFAADQVEAFLDAEGLDCPTIMGSSFGGAVAMTLALRRPERLKSLVLVSPVLARSQIPLAFPGFVDFLEAPQPIANLVAPLAVQIMGGFALDREGRDEIVREARNFTGAELKRRLSILLNLNLLPAAAKLRLPMLWVHGNRDMLVPWRRGRDAAKAIGTRHFELMHGAGHLPYLSHPDEFNQVVSLFLSAVEGGLDRRLEHFALPADHEEETGHASST